MICRLIDDARDREELAQDIFVKIYHNLSSFNYESKLSTWIATIAYRHCVTFLKRNKKWKMEDSLDEKDSMISYQDIELESTDLAGHIRILIDQLPEHYRIILTLFHLEGMTYPEIVEITDMPEGTVKNYLIRARKQLKDLLLPFLQREQLTYG